MHRSWFRVVLLGLVGVILWAQAYPAAAGAAGQEVEEARLSPPESLPPIEENAPYPPIYLEVRGFGQEHMLTCEAATIRMVLTFLGLDVSEEEIQSVFPVVENPEEGYRGPDINTGATFYDYGAHAPAVAKNIQHFLDREDLPYVAAWRTFATEEEALAVLHRSLDRGLPAIVWMTWRANGGRIPETMTIPVSNTVTVMLSEHLGYVHGTGSDRIYMLDPQPDTDVVSLPAAGGATPQSLRVRVPGEVTLVLGEHVEVVYGMEDGWVHVIDPWSFQRKEGEYVWTLPNGFHQQWKGAPAGWSYFDYAIVYLKPRP
jgi:uncharacterized protein YvpB